MASKTPVTTVHPSHTQSQKASTEPHKKYKKKKIVIKRRMEWRMSGVWLLCLFFHCEIPAKRG